MALVFLAITSCAKRLHTSKLLQGATPYYLQIEAILRDQIVTGDLRPGDLVPTEKTLCEQYGVSRPTVRQAIKNLEIDDLLVRERGKRTRITERPEELILPLFDISVSELVGPANADGIVVARTSKCISPPNVRAEFGFKERLEVFSFVRVYFRDDVPYMASKSFLPVEVAELLSDEDLAADNFLDNLSQICGKEIVESAQKIEAILAEPSMAKFLEIGAGTPLLSVKRTSRDINLNPVEHCHTLIRTDRGKLGLALGRNSVPGKWRVQ